MEASFNITAIRLYNLLKTKLGDKEAEEFVALVKQKVANTFDSKKEILATKTDIAVIDVKLSQLETTIAKTESKLILWAFVFWATQLAAMIAFLKFFGR